MSITNTIITLFDFLDAIATINTFQLLYHNVNYKSLAKYNFLCYYDI